MKLNRKGIYGLVIGMVFLFFSCQKDPLQDELQTPLLNEVPKGFPPVPFPADNGFTEDRWALGKKLFYDTRLSLTNEISCASCHRQDLAFADDRAVSFGIEKRLGNRNAPTLANVAYHPYLLREGGVPTLEMQINVPIQEHAEFSHDILKICEELAKDEEINQMALQAYGQGLNPYTLTRSIANFERTLLSGNSRYDQFVFQGKDVLSQQEKRGMELFYSEKTKCGTTCHSGFNFTDYSFQNNGLYEIYVDSGRKRLTHQWADWARFKVPSLRNVELTAPYMHDGSVRTLEEVIDHYDSGGKPFVNKSSILKPLSLTKQEKEDLISFLRTLTDYRFIRNKNFEE